MAITRHSSQVNQQKKRSNVLPSQPVPMTIRTRSKFKRQQHAETDGDTKDDNNKRSSKRFKVGDESEPIRTSVKNDSRLNLSNNHCIDVVVANTSVEGGFFDSDGDMSRPVSPTSSVFSTDENAYDTAASPGDSVTEFPLKKIMDFDRLNDADQFMTSDDDEYEFFDLPDEPAMDSLKSTVTVKSEDQSDVVIPDEYDDLSLDVFDTEQSINTMPDLSEPLALDNGPVFKSFDESSISAQSPAWPMEDDQTLFFSVLLNKKPSDTAASSVAQTAQPSMSAINTEKYEDSPSIEEFVDYDSAESSSSSENAAESSWIDKYNKIPISGFRLATYQQPLTSYYRQTMSAKGLNRRALWSGRARQMLGGVGYLNA